MVERHNRLHTEVSSLGKQLYTVEKKQFRFIFFGFQVFFLLSSLCFHYIIDFHIFFVCPTHVYFLLSIFLIYLLPFFRLFLSHLLQLFCHFKKIFSFLNYPIFRAFSYTFFFNSSLLEIRSFFYHLKFFFQFAIN